MADQLNYEHLFTREHPFYRWHKDTWRHNHRAYSGGKEYIQSALVKHISEVDEEFCERRIRGYYFNWPRKIARIITQYVLSVRPDRQGGNPDLVEDWNRCGLRVDEVMRQFSTYLNVFGAAWLAVDMPAFEGPMTKADEIKKKLRPYCVALNPLQVTDWCYGADGELDWVLVKEFVYDNSDPFTSAKDVQVVKLWTRNALVWASHSTDGSVEHRVTPHDLGVVPFIRKVEVDGFGLDANHWFDDVVSISDAILNNESEAQMNIIKQAFGLLIVPDSFVNNIDRPQSSSDDGDAPLPPPGSNAVAKVLSRSAAITEAPEERGIARYICPNGASNSAIRAENEALVRMMFECVGLAVSKDTKMVESAEAKLWDFQNIEQFMKTRADVLEQSEVQAWQLMNKWMSTVPVPTVSYNRNFSVLDLQQAVSTLTELSAFNADSPTYQKEIGKTAAFLHNRLRQVAQDRQEEIVDEVENSTPAAPPVPGNPDIDKEKQDQE